MCSFLCRYCRWVPHGHPRQFQNKFHYINPSAENRSNFIISFLVIFSSLFLPILTANWDWNNVFLFIRQCIGITSHQHHTKYHCIYKRFFSKISSATLSDNAWYCSILAGFISSFTVVPVFLKPSSVDWLPVKWQASGQNFRCAAFYNCKRRTEQFPAPVIPRCIIQFRTDLTVGDYIRLLAEKSRNIFQFLFQQGFTKILIHSVKQTDRYCHH